MDIRGVKRHNGRLRCALATSLQGPGLRYPLQGGFLHRHPVVVRRKPRRRHPLMLKVFLKLIHPRAFLPVRLSGKVIPDEVMRGVQRFTVLYLFFFLVSALGLNWMGVDFTTSISSAAAALSNVDPLASFSVMPEPGKWLLIYDMLLGRLEISSPLILLLPTFWNS